MFDLAEMEKAKFGTGKEVLVSTLGGIEGDLMSWSAPSAGDDEKLVVNLKPFIRVIVAAEKQTRLFELNKGVGKIFDNQLIRVHGSAIGKGRFVAADNYIVNCSILLALFKLVPIPARLFLDLFRGQGGKVGIEQDNRNILPEKTVPAPSG